MAGRGPRDRSRHLPDTPPPTGPDAALVRIRDLAGRPRGLGFAADHHGTVVTSHEAVDGLARLALYGTDDRSCVVTADAVTPLPERGLALVRTDGLGTELLPLTVRDRVELLLVRTPRAPPATTAPWSTWPATSAASPPA